MNYANYVLKSKNIFTGLSDSLIAGGVAICENSISAIGSIDEIDKLVGPETIVYEFEDALIMPGFNDSHVHLPDASLLNDDSYCVNLLGCKSEEECVDLVEKFAEMHPENEWIYGWGWIEWNWAQPTLPSHRSLERIKTNRPICLQACHMHTAWVNKRAMAICGITADSNNPKGGVIGRFDDGEPNGLLFEAEGVLVATSKAFELSDVRLKSAFSKYLKKASAVGITSIGDVFPRGVAKANAYDLYRELENDNNLPVRIHFFPELKQDLSDAREYKAKFHSNKVRFAGLKQFVDGVPENHTGYFLEPYEDMPETRGFLTLPADMLCDMVINADSEGLGVRLHAMGDAAIRIGLDCFEAAKEKNGTGKSRHALEHVENIDSEDISRFHKLGVIASMQPRHFTLNIDGHHLLVGEKRSEHFYALKSIIDSGAMYSHGSDAPVTSIDPIPAIYAGTTRATEAGLPEGGYIPNEKVSMYEILRGFTLGSSYIEGFENRVGTLETGKLADITVLNQNLFAISGKKILETKVLFTMMDGKITYELIDISSKEGTR